MSNNAKRISEGMRRQLYITGLQSLRSSILLVCFFSMLLADGTTGRTQRSAAFHEDTTTRPELVLQTGHTSKVNCAVFGPDGRWLATGGADNAIKIWDVATGRELRALMGRAI